MGPQERNLSLLSFMQHDLFIRTTCLWKWSLGVHVCRCVPRSNTHRGFTLEEVAESRVEKGGLDGAENSCRSQYRSTNIGMNMEEEGTYSLFSNNFCLQISFFCKGSE